MSLSILWFCSALSCLMVASCQAAAVLTTDATCSAVNPDFSTTTNTSPTGRCTLFIGNWQVSTSATTQFAFTPGTNKLAATFMLSAFADSRTNQGCVLGTECGQLHADVNAEYDINLVTAGPPRTGVLLLNYTGTYGNADTFSSSFFALNNMFVPCLIAPNVACIILSRGHHDSLG